MALRTPIGTGDADDRRVDFAELWADRDILRSYCRRIVGDTSLVDDMVQEAYTEAFVKLEHLERRASFLPWLATVAKRRGLNELRRYRYAVPVEVLPDRAGAGEPDPADAASTRDRLQRLRDALTALTPRERTLLMRSVNDGLSATELALMEGSTPGSVRSVLLRARSKLKRFMEDGVAWVFAPVTSVAHWAKRRLDQAAVRATEVTPVTTAACERLGEVMAAVVVATAVVGSGGGAGAPVVRVLSASATSPASPTDTDAELAPAQASASDGLGARASLRGSRATDAAAAAPALGGPATPSTSPSGSDTSPSAPTGTPVTTPITTPSTTPEPPPPPVNNDPVSEPEDAQFFDFAVTGGSSPEIFALGTNAGTCGGDCTVLFHSPDGGTTWNKLRADGLSGATQLLVAPGYPQDSRIYAMTPTGLRLSRDRGAGFQAVAGGDHPGTGAVSPEFSRDDERILIANQPSWVYDAKADKSTPFTAAPMTGPQNFFAFAPDYAASKLLFAATFVNGPGVARKALIYRCTEDDCDTGTEVAGLRGAPHLSVSSRFAEDGIVFAWNEDDLVRSEDGGRSFQTVDLPEPGVVNGVVDDGHGNVYAAIFDDRGDAGGVLWSADGGTKWTLRGAGTALADGGQVVTTLPNGNVLAAAVSDEGAGVLCSADHGLTWFSRCSLVSP